jgi:hypothetical protein
MITKISKDDHLVENKIVRNLILSTEFARKVFQIYNSEYIQNKYSKIIIGWIKNYFDEYNESPKIHMVDIFELKKKDIKEDEYEYIEALLQFLSNEDEYDETEKINHNYIFKETEKYFQKRSYQQLAEKLENASIFGDIEKTQKILSDFRVVEHDLSGWIDPFNDQEIRKAFDSQDEQDLFKMPGKLGELIGTLKRSQLMIVMAPAKRGKTMMLQEIACMAILHKFNVVFISLEMNAERSKLRLYRRLTGLSDSGEIKIPVMDCLLNQTGQCNKKHRKNNITIMNSDGEITQKKGYKICDFCREKYPKNFIQTIWYINKKSKKFEYNSVDERIKKFKKWYHPNLRFLNCRGKKMSQIVNSINILEQSEGFIPDVIIPDYFAIAAPENSQAQQRDKINQAVWIGKTLAEERNCFVASGHQGNRASFDAKIMKEIHTSEDIRVLGDVDKLIGLMQTNEEKQRGILKASTLVDRDEHFVVNQSVSMLCNFGIGQIHLDSEWGEIN